MPQRIPLLCSVPSFANGEPERRLAFSLASRDGRTRLRTHHDLIYLCRWSCFLCRCLCQGLAEGTRRAHKAGSDADALVVLELRRASRMSRRINRSNLFCVAVTSVRRPKRRGPAGGGARRNRERITRRGCAPGHFYKNGRPYGEERQTIARITQASSICRGSSARNCSAAKSSDRYAQRGIHNVPRVLQSRRIIHQVNERHDRSSDDVMRIHYDDPTTICRYLGVVGFLAARSRSEDLAALQS